MTRRCSKFTEENKIYENFGCAACGNFEWKEREEQSVYHQESPDVEPHCKLGFPVEEMLLRERRRKGARTRRGRKELESRVTKVTRKDIEFLTLEDLQKLVEQNTPPPPEPEPEVSRGNVPWKLLKERIEVIPDWSKKPQDPKALTQHFGIYANVGQLHLSCSSNTQTSMHISISWESTEYSWTKEEYKKVLELFEELDLKVLDHWGGHQWISVNFSVGHLVVGPKWMEGVYHRGCQKKGKFILSQERSGRIRDEDEGKEVEHSTGSVFCDCGWFAEGRSKVEFPKGWG